VDSSENANVSEKHTGSIFRAEKAILESGGIYIGLEEGRAEGVSQSGTRNKGGGGKVRANWKSPYKLLPCLIFGALVIADHRTLTCCIM
jgi:hypothetical protein